jgi:hypothetical protein
MEAAELLALLPDNILEDIALETQVDKYTKKLHGEIIFKLLIHCILSFKDNSLRRMESAYESVVFKLLNANIKSETISFSSISERLSVIEPAYFEKLYKKCIETYSAILIPAKTEFIRFDSTIVALSGKLLNVGYHIQGGGAAHLKQLKFTVGYSNLPVAIHFFTEQTYSSENEALKEGVLSYDKNNTSIIRIFDRGITARKTYDEFIEKDIPFISRLTAKSKRDFVRYNTLPEMVVQTPTLHIYSDSWVYLYKAGWVRADHPVRCIEALIKTTGETILFVTNIESEILSAADVTIFYKCRWEIEVFFKFIKQELSFSHLINRSENGIKVMLYCTMIAAILLLVYKEINGLKGYKIMKQRFINDLEKSLMKDIVVMCGGDPYKLETLLKSPPE